MKHNTLNELFTSVANAIRAKTGKTGNIIADNFPDEINNISVGVEGGIIPAGTKQIVANGTHNVSTYEYAEVNVPVGITPSGTKSITENGTFDVTQYASASVNVPQKSKVIDLNITSQLGGTSTTINTVVTGDDFVKANYSKDGFSVTLSPLSPVPMTQYAVCSIYHGNRALSQASTSWYGQGQYNASASNTNAFQIAGKVSASTYQAGFRCSSNGNIVLYLPANRYLLTGSYKLILTCDS